MIDEREREEGGGSDGDGGGWMGWRDEIPLK